MFQNPEELSTSSIQSNIELKFFCGNEHATHQCCFNHIVGMPRKNDKPTSIFDYEMDIVNALKDHKKIYVKKATGLGVTELVLRWIAWKAFTDKEWDNSQVIIITGPRLELAISLIDRMKDLFPPRMFESRNNIIKIKNVKIEAYPSHHLDAARGIPNPKCILLDEADFFQTSQQNEARAIAERYIAKSNPNIILVSTPNMPGGLFDTMEHDPTTDYFPIFIDYKVGLGKIFKEEDIIEAKKSPSFEREYNLQYGLGTGNIFDNQLLDEITENYSLENTQGVRVLSVDPAFGNSDKSSKFAYVGAEKRGDIIYIVDAGEISRASPNAMQEFIKSKYTQGNYSTLQIDSAFPGMVRDYTSDHMNSKGIVFREVLTNMTTHATTMVQEKKVRIHPSFSLLIAQLKAIEFNDKGHPDKKKLNFDAGDAFLMSLFYYSHHIRARKLKGKF